MELFFKDFVFKHGEILPALILTLCALSLGLAIQTLKSNRKCWKIAYCLFITALCVIGRSYMLATPFPLSDESEQIAAAYAVLKHGDFYGRVLVGTHGPIMTFILVGLNLLGMPLDSTCVHLFVVLLQICIGMMLIIIFYKIGLSRWSILASFPYFAFVAFSLYPELTTYNAEIVTSCFPLLSLYFLLVYKDSWKGISVFLSGFFLGFIPFLKIQFLPHAFVLIVFQFFFIVQGSRHRRRDLLLCFAGLAAPALAQIAYGFINPLVFIYYKHFATFQAGYLGKQSNSLIDKLLNIYYTLKIYAGFDRDSNIFVNVFLVPISAIFAFTFYRIKKIFRMEHSEDISTTILLISLCYAAIASAMFPGRPFIHYILACVPFVFCLYGYILFSSVNHCNELVLAFIFSVTALAYPVSSVFNDHGHLDAANSPVNRFSGDFLSSLRKCAACANGVFVTNPHYELYAVAKSSSPLKEVSAIFDFLGNIHRSKQYLLETLKESPPSVIVNTDEDNPKFSIENKFPELLQYLNKNYSQCSNSNNATLWRYIEPKFDIVNECTPCNIKLINFSNKEINTDKNYTYLWTTNKIATIFFQSRGESYIGSISMLSPLFNNVIDVLVNDNIVDTISLHKGDFPENAAHRVIEFSTLPGLNSIQLRIATINKDNDRVLPDETRLLGVQILQSVFKSLDHIKKIQ